MKKTKKSSPIPKKMMSCFSLFLCILVFCLSWTLEVVCSRGTPPFCPFSFFSQSGGVQKKRKKKYIEFCFRLFLSFFFVFLLSV